MLEQIPLLLATPIAKAILDKFYEGVGSKLGEKAVELLPEKAKQLIQKMGQLVWDRNLKQKPGAEAVLQKAATGSDLDQQKVTDFLHRVLEQDATLRKDTQSLATQFYHVIQQNVSAENLQQIFGGQGLQINEKQEQPIIQIQGNPTLHFGSSQSD